MNQPSPADDCPPPGQPPPTCWAGLPLEIDVHSVDRLVQSGEDLLFLDVRQPEEYQVAAIAGTVLIPLGQLGSRLNELEPYRHKRIVVHCHHGVRSLRAAAGLRQAGFEAAQSMAGGIEDWSLQVNPQVPRY